jgi:DNA-binding transcriptional MerR regulator/methylmalonyl-CoA mutase cobalamin-binding subunit
MILNSEYSEDLITIGELSKLTGIGIHTLRVWEKRYGAPESIRLPSNHRRYPRIEVERLQAINKALESGHRPSEVVGRTFKELDYILQSTSIESDWSEKDYSEIGLTISNWLEAALLYDEELLSSGLRHVWNTKGPMNFIIDYAVPFVKKVGIAWRSQELTISQEHFASELLGVFLSEKWKKLNQKKDNTNVVLANIPGETHKLGLQMCAVVTALSDHGVVFLGSNNSSEGIVSVFEECEAKLLGVSVSGCFDAVNSEIYIRQLRSQLSDRVAIAVGGEGAPANIPGVARFSDFSEYYKWLESMSD